LRASRVSTLASALEAALGAEPPRPRRGLELVEPDAVPEPEPAPA
jgi:hypothetical protein